MYAAVDDHALVVDNAGPFAFLKKLLERRGQLRVSLQERAELELERTARGLVVRIATERVRGLSRTLLLVHPGAKLRPNRADSFPRLLAELVHSLVRRALHLPEQ